MSNNDSGFPRETSAVGMKTPAPIPGLRLAGTAPDPSDEFAVITIPKAKAFRVAIYGAGGVGKSELANAAPDPVFLDIAGEGGLHAFNPKAIRIKDFAHLRRVLAKREIFAPFKTIVVDTATAVEALCGAWVLNNIKKDNGEVAANLEDYGYGKGNRYVFLNMRYIMEALEQLYAAGKNIVLVCHDIRSMHKNPQGDDYAKYDLLLQDGEKTSVRKLVTNWVDIVAHVAMDVAINDEGKAVGTGSRAISCKDTPSRAAKCRGDITTTGYARGKGAEFWAKVAVATTGGAA